MNIVVLDACRDNPFSSTAGSKGLAPLDAPPCSVLQAEDTNRAMRSIAHQIKAARFPLHRDLAGFDFSASPVDQDLVLKLAQLAWTEQAHNVVLIGGPGT